MQPSLDHRNDEQLREQITQRLRSFPVQTLHSGTQHAAVAVVIADEGPGAGLPGLPQPAAWSDRAAMHPSLSALWRCGAPSG